jgi:hypothetical protein
MRLEDTYPMIESLLNISGRIMNTFSIFPVIRWSFIIWNDGEYNVKGVEEISIPSKEGDFPVFGYTIPIALAHQAV